jgi:small subunit ribosomal protein S20
MWAEIATIEGSKRPARLEAGGGALLRSRSPQSGRFCVMPNIKQQKKRVRTATRERLENLRYRSTVKTLTKRLETAVADGDQERAAAEHRELVRAIDKAASRQALHRNTAARKKAQAARLLSGS